MPINLQGSGPIVEGWGPAPQLHAPELGSLVHAILSNRLGQQALSEKTGTDVAEIIQKRKDAETLATYRAALAGEAGSHANLYEALANKSWTYPEGTSRGGSGGGSGQPGDATGPEFVYDKDGTKYLVVRTSKSVTYHRVPNQSGGGPTKLSPTEKGWAAPEIPGLSVNINAPDEPAQTLQPDVPPAPDAVPTRPTADQSGGHATDYGTDATSMSADDVRAAYKAGKMTREEAAARLKQLGFGD